MEKLFVTKNSVKVYSYDLAHLHGFCLSLNIKAGKMYEDNAGITHLLEHMFFRRLDDLDQAALYRELDKYGLKMNGITHKEFLRFELIGNSKYFKEACDIFCKLLAPARFTTADLVAEQKRICRELQEREYGSSVEHLANKEVWQGTTLTRYATPTDMKKISLKKLKAEKEKIFDTNNLFFYVTGNTSEENLNYLYSQIESYTMNSSAEIRQNLVAPSENFFQRQPSIRTKKSYYNYVSFSFDYDTKKYGEHEIDILYDLLFEGNCAAFYYALSEKKGLIYDFTSYIERYDNLGRFYLSYEISIDDLYDSVEATMSVLNSLKHDISDFDFERVKLSYVDNDTLLDDADELNWQLSYDNHILSYGYSNLNEYGKLYSNVTKERVKTIAQEIFRTQNLTIAVRTEKQLSLEKLDSICKNI